jgi:hypothetical protein
MITRLRSYDRPPMSELRPLGILLAVVLVVQVAYFVRIQSIYPPYGLTTEHFHSPLAVNLLDHGVYGFGEYPEIERTTKRPPLYAVVLAGVYGLFGENEAYGLALNNIFLFSTTIVVYLIGRTLSPKVGLIAALLFALDPVGVMNANKNNGQALYALLMALFLLAMLRNFTPSASLKRTISSSLFLALATMTRAVTVYLWLPLLVSFLATHWWLIKRIPMKRVAALTLVFFVIHESIIGGWMIRNNSVDGNPDFASEQGLLFYNFFGPLVLSRVSEVSYKEAKTSLTRELETSKEYQQMTIGEQQGYILRKGLEIVFDHPLASVTVYLEHVPALFLDYPIGAATMFYGEGKRQSLIDYITSYTATKSSRLDLSGYADAISNIREKGAFLVLAHAAAYKLYYLLAMLSIPAGLTLLWLDKSHRPVAIFLAIYIGYVVFASSFWPTARFRMPLLPATAVVSAYFWMWAWIRIESYRERGRTRLV